MRAQRPPCLCDFEVCLELAQDGAVPSYFHKGLDLLDMYNTETEDDDTYDRRKSCPCPKSSSNLGGVDHLAVLNSSATRRTLPWT